MVSHKDLDRRSRALHCLVVEKIRRDPTLIDRAHAILARWRETVCPGTQIYLTQWETLLSDPEKALAVAIEDSERADTLRQSSPLSCLLTPKERRSFLRNWRASEATNRLDETDELPASYPQESPDL